MSEYTYTEEINGRGMECRFDGPGLSQYDRARFESTYDANQVLTMLARAYKAGQKAAQAEIRKALGICEGFPNVYGESKLIAKR